MIINSKDLPEKLIKYLFDDIDVTNESNRVKIFLITLYSFNIITHRLKHDVMLSKIDYDFFNKLSKFKKKLLFKCTISNNMIYLHSIIFVKNNGTINLLARKKLFKLFNDHGIKLEVDKINQKKETEEYKII